ncbi:MAG: low molecular weight phosphotyrosine protein phosphatase [Phycisphaerae bacterium]|jgi:protein-tyrosine phosphatase|nr:low molecular weight phosphotyrosine protein phosphatase [Phycisphaerae bacterium]
MAASHRILFVCMGNICRSPVAEGVFIHRARERGVLDRFEVDSAGTGGWHAGERPDRRSLAVAAKHGIELPSRARQVTQDDFIRFDRLIVMDRENHSDLLDRGAPKSKLEFLLAYHPEPAILPRGIEVPDPYYGGPEGFDDMYSMIDAACVGLLDELLRSRS